MTIQTGTVSQWIAQVKSGNDVALANLHQRYWPSLVGLARRRLNGVPVGDRDAEDVAQDAFVAMYQALRKGKTPGLDNRHQWLAFLSHIIACKAVNEIKRANAKKRGGNRRTRQMEFPDLAVLNDNYDPEQQAILRDCYAFYLGCLPEHLRQFAELHLAGFSVAEMAQRLGCVRRTVDRKIRLLKLCWQEIAESELGCSTEELLIQNKN